MTVTRHHILGRLDAVRALLLAMPIDRTDEIFADAATFSQSHKSGAEGRAAVVAALMSSFEGLELDYLSFNNKVARADGALGVVSAYLHGRARRQGSEDKEVMFGGLILLALGIDGEHASIFDVSLQLIWAEGDIGLLEGWHLPPAKRHWQPGDRPPVIVSELDAPWHLVPHSDLVQSDEEAVAAAWFRYAWALDQADYALFDGAFAETVEAELTPMGRMKGKRLLLGTLKAFRMPWPWMQHHGEPIEVEIAPDGRTATMILGRIIPGQVETDLREPLYGAHYRIEAIRTERAGWIIGKMEYFPGWITRGPG